MLSSLSASPKVCSRLHISCNGKLAVPCSLGHSSWGLEHAVALGAAGCAPVPAESHEGGLVQRVEGDACGLALSNAAAEEVGTVGAWLVEVTEEDDGSEELLAPLEE